MKPLFSFDMIPQYKKYSFISIFSGLRLFALPRFFSAVLLLILSIFTLSSHVYAVEINDLYQAKIKVASQSSLHEKEALKKAMENVLLKVGGADIFSNKLIKQAIIRNNQYLLQLSYVHDLTFDAALSNDNTVNRGGDEESLFLHALFSEKKINQLLVKANLPIWGRLRPQVLLWFVEESGFERRILSDASSSPYPALVHQHTQQRGLPLVLPLMDLDDLTQVNIADVWGRFVEPLKPVATRYLAEASVIIRLSNSSLLDESKVDCQPLCKNTYHALDWTLFLAKEEFSKKYKGNDTDQLLSNALTDITQEIYHHYALVNQPNDDDYSFYIDVANVDSMATYVNIIQFIEELSAVQSVTLVNAEGENRRFSLQLLATQQAFLSSLKLNNELTLYVDPLAANHVDAIPLFYWGSDGPQHDNAVNEDHNTNQGNTVPGDRLNNEFGRGMQ